MTIPNHRATFLQEAEDLLEQIEAVTLALEATPGDLETVNRLFRAFHTIKGSGSMFGFDAVADFTHHVESALDKVREGRLLVTPPFISLILASRDHLHSLIESEPEGTPALNEIGARLAADIAVIAGADAPAPLTIPSPTTPDSTPGALSTYTIFFRPDPCIFSTGMDPVCLLNDLRSLGECSIAVNLDTVPPLDQLVVDHCYLSWTITLTTSYPQAAIRDVFIFAEDGAELTIQCASATEAAAQDITSHPEQKKAEPATPSPASSVPGKAAAAQSSIRVPSERLDRLVNLVGELVINQSRLSQAQAHDGSPELAGPVEAMERLIADLRDSVLGIRMMPIGATFSRFQRLVRDLSSDLGKEIDLVTEGADTEMDKTVIDNLGDPLVHLIRNSMDHGVESPEDRLAKGKSRRGTLKLTAAHEGAHVVITIEDDGRGLDKSAIRAKAVEKGLITADAQLTDQETFNLVFLPGFSTARVLSSVSGRGVGMDVVKRAIEGLRGAISLSSIEGRGTIVRLSLPLTLAIIDGLLVEIEGDRYIVPMNAVTENVELTRQERIADNGRNAVDIRGALVPYIPLRELFEIRGREPDLEKIVVVQVEAGRVGLVVDRVIGSHQTVIQSLGLFYRDIDLFSGTTIMGDGRVAMILNLAGILRYATRRHGARDHASATH